VRTSRFFAILTARNREFVRDRSALAWNILLPVFIVLGFAFAFSGDRLDLYKIGVYGEQPEEAGYGNFLDMSYVKFLPVDDLDVAIVKVDRHQLDMLLDLDGQRFWINETSPKGYVLERVLSGSTDTNVVKQTVRGRAVRYVDWLIPGILAMNMMFSALFGVGYVIVRYRKNGVLKRLKATPLTAFEFLAAQVASRLWLIVVLTVAVYSGTNAFVGFTMHGSYLNLLLVLILGAICLISLGLLIAARIASEELAGGLLNMISWPMMFLSGVWFSLEGLHPLLQDFALVFPLTHVIDAARAIMIDGAGLIEIAPELAALVSMSALFLAVGSLGFRWE
jgi:ABC-type multidrug transport system permease subunit